MYIHTHIGLVLPSCINCIIWWMQNVRQDCDRVIELAYYHQLETFALITETCIIYGIKTNGWISLLILSQYSHVINQFFRESEFHYRLSARNKISNIVSLLNWLNYSDKLATALIIKSIYIHNCYKLQFSLFPLLQGAPTDSPDGSGMYPPPSFNQSIANSQHYQQQQQAPPQSYYGNQSQGGAPQHKKSPPAQQQTQQGSTMPPPNQQPPHLNQQQPGHSHAMMQQHHHLESQHSQQQQYGHGGMGHNPTYMNTVWIYAQYFMSRLKDTLFIQTFVSFSDGRWAAWDGKFTKYPPLWRWRRSWSNEPWFWSKSDGGRRSKSLAWTRSLCS